MFITEGLIELNCIQVVLTYNLNIKYFRGCVMIKQQPVRHLFPEINISVSSSSVYIISMCLYHFHGFPDSSVGKESACNAGDPSSTPGSGRSPGEGIGYALQYSWASLMAQVVKKSPTMWETWVQSLRWEDSPGEGKGYPTPVFWPGEWQWTV